MNRKIALSGLSIMGALLIMGGATFAAFNDTATATNNTFAVGTLDLQISAVDGNLNPTGFGESIDAPDFNGMLPGDVRSYNFWLRNENASGSAALDVTADVSAIAQDNDMDDTLLVSWVCDTNGNNSLGDETPSGKFSPRAWLDGGMASVIPGMPAGAQRFCQLTGELPASATEVVEGQSVVFDVLYNGVQVIVSPAP